MCARCGNFVESEDAAALASKNEAAIRRRSPQHNVLILLKKPEGPVYTRKPWTLKDTRGKDSVRGLLYLAKAYRTEGVHKPWMDRQLSVMPGLTWCTEGTSARDDETVAAFACTAQAGISSGYYITM